MPYEMPSALEEAIRSFVGYYNYQRYHEALGNVSPYDVYTGRYLEILQPRREVNNKILETRKDYNRTVRERGTGL